MQGLQTRTIVLGLLGLALIVAVWMGRYDMQQPQAGSGVYVMDRWTGAMEFCYKAGGCKSVDRE